MAGCKCNLEEGDSECAIHDRTSCTVAELYCGEVHPTRKAICSLAILHIGDHHDESIGVHWAARATLPDLPVPSKPRINGVLRCYFCGGNATDIVNEDIPTCGAHGRK